MKKDVTLVPKDKCPLDILAEMKEQTKSAWIFLHRNAVEKLISTAEDHSPHPNNDFQELRWNATDDFPETVIWIDLDPDEVWLQIFRIDADDIAFTLPDNDPEEIFFLKMEE